MSTPEGMTYEKKYARFEEINGVIFIVLCCKLTNTTENNLQFNPVKYISLPEDIASRIIDLEGKSVNDTGSSSNICSSIGLYGADAELYNQLVGTFQNQPSANQMRFRLVAALNVPANSSMYYSFREFITLI